MSECAKYRHMQRNLSGLRTTAVAAILLFMFERQVHCACTQMAVVSEQGGGGRGKMEECITNVCLQSPCIWIERINTNCVCQVTQFWSCRVNTDKRLKIRLKGSPDRPPPPHPPAPLGGCRCLQARREMQPLWCVLVLPLNQSKVIVDFSVETTEKSSEKFCLQLFWSFHARVIVLCRRTWKQTRTE